MEWIQHIDEQAILWISQQVQEGLISRLMIGISTLGNQGLIFIGLGILMALIGIRQHAYWRNRGILLLSSLGATALVVNLLLKPLVARTRPFDLLSISLMIPPPHDFSFPSGHTAAAFATAVVFCSFGFKWGIGAVIFAILMAISRLYLLVHFPSDVIAGAIIGIIVSSITLAVVKRKFPAH